ncbi:MAG: hypothetical protein QOJ29_917, partial [Thermoleophilaceae bacterium]|nr:hypothetical protein [Thermoleophilaceae bacterium]
MQGSGSQGRLDYAIVGAGVSGLYTAWRLLQDAKGRGANAPSIAVFENDDRTGGRLLTWLPAGEEGGLRAELGGMRFFEAQQLVWNLIHHIGLGDRMTTFWVEGPNLRLLLRGLSRPANDPEPTARYDLPANLKGRSPGAIVQDTIINVLQAAENWPCVERYLPGDQAHSLSRDREAWDTIKPFLTWRGTRLWDVGFWNLLSDMHTAETYQYLSDSLGYFSLTGNWNAAEAMGTMALDFSVSDYMSLDAGYGKLPDTLAAQAKELGCEINLNTRLVGFELQDDGSSRLELAPAEGDRYPAEAEHLVLAMPRRSLELLAPSRAFDIQGDQRLKRLISTVKPQPAFKLYLFYEERWWERLGISHGRSVSDLPLRQTYYLAPQPWKGDGPIPEYGMLLASYDDAQSVDFWDGLAKPVAEREGDSKTLRDAIVQLVGESSAPGNAEEFVPEPPPHLHLATDEMLRHARSQIALLHDVPESEVPKAVVGGYGDWARDPFGGGWNFWDSQVDVRAAMTDIKTPLGPYHR